MCEECTKSEALENFQFYTGLHSTFNNSSKLLFKGFQYLFLQIRIFSVFTYIFKLRDWLAWQPQFSNGSKNVLLFSDCVCRCVCVCVVRICVTTCSFIPCQKYKEPKYFLYQTHISSTLKWMPGAGCGVMHKEWKWREGIQRNKTKANNLL